MNILDGKKTSADVKTTVADRVRSLHERGFTVGLAVIQVGADPASSVYVRNKRRTCEALGIQSFGQDLPEDTSESELLERIAVLNADAKVHGILVQLPLPGHIDSQRVIEAISPQKDVDGFHPVNVGLLSTGGKALAPCTPSGVMEMLARYDIPLEGKNAIVIGRSNIVGKPMAQLLLQKNATVTIAHSRTQNLEAQVREADIVVAAVGRAEMVRGSWVKPGAVVVDVGIQRGTDGKLVGDVAFEEMKAVAGWCSPVPGGVGPMTIAMLMSNTVQSAEWFANEENGGARNGK